ncbi:MAG: helix-turn-helix domain-containing protein [Acidobacteriota bacterium]
MEETPSFSGAFNEKRRSVRFRFLSKAEVFRTGESGGQSRPVEVLDVSAGGILLDFHSPPPPIGTPLTVKIGAYLYLFGEIYRISGVRGRGLAALKLRGSEWYARRKLSDQLNGKLFGVPWSFELHGLKCDPFRADARLRRVRILVYRYPRQRVTLETAARVTGLDPIYFSSFFRRTVGVPFRAWLHWVRVARSIVLLSNNDLAIKEVADLAGFSNVRSFERLFRQHTSLTPRQFKQLQKP